MNSIPSTLIACATVFAALSIGSGQARALNTVTMSSAGIAAVGNLSGATWLCVEPTNGGSPQWTFVAGNQLTDDVLIRGTNSQDLIEVATSSTTLCGRSDWLAPNLNGHSLDLQGRGGNDAVIGGIGSEVRGGSGHDWLVAKESSAAFGEDGEDIVWGVSSVSVLSGGTGNDFLCAMGGINSVLGMFGDAGFDRRCKTAFFLQSVENGSSDNCVPCTLGPLALTLD